jgi:hypothetical protein
MRIEIRCGPDQIDAACAALGEVLEPAPASADDIGAELRVMRQELALETDARILASELWLACLGTAGLDPVGSLPSIAAATPELLNGLAKRQFGAQNLVVSIVGPGDVDSFTEAGKRLLASRQPTSDAAWVRRAEGRPARVETRRAEGEARGALVGAFSRAETAWALAAALALASEVGPAFVSYTPSMQPGLIIVGREGELSGFGRKIDALTDADVARLYPTGKDLARRWVMGYLDTASGTAFLRGTLVAQALGARPESLLENIARMSAEDFAKGMAAFAQDRCGVVIGVGR